MKLCEKCHTDMLCVKTGAVIQFVDENGSRATDLFLCQECGNIGAYGMSSCIDRSGLSLYARATTPIKQRMLSTYYDCPSILIISISEDLNNFFKEWEPALYSRFEVM